MYWHVMNSNLEEKKSVEIGAVQRVSVYNGNYNEGEIRKHKMPCFESKILFNCLLFYLYKGI